MVEQTVSNSHNTNVSLTNPMRRFAKDSVFYSIAKSVPALTAFASAFIFTRVFTTSDYGLYSLVLAIINPITIALTEWAGQPIGRFYSEYYVGGRGSEYSNIVRTLALLVLSLSILAGLLIATLGARSWGWSLALAVIFLIPAQAMTNVLSPILPASLDTGYYRFLEISRAILNLGFSATLVFFLFRSPAGLIWGMLLGTLCMLPFLLRRVKRRLQEITHDSKIALHEDSRLKEGLGRFIRYGSPMLFWFFAAQLLAIGDRYLLQFFRGSTEVGIYSANYNLISGISGLLSGPVTMAAFPIIMRLWANGDHDGLVRTLSKMTGFYLVLGIGMVGGTAAVGFDFVSIALGEQFRVGYTILVPVLAGQVLWQASILGHKGLELAEKTYVMLRWAGLAASLNFILNLIFIPHNGYLAAAYTTLVSYGVYTVLILFSSRGTLPWRIPFWLVFKSGIACIIALFTVWFSYPPGNGWLSFLLRGFLFTGVYLATILLAELPRIKVLIR
ncbi:Polysaccharide biosynthesis protein [Neomoorella glycerini]|uniref:Polysaccharide biosynthesis protein n=1 Tax=Neomoorella glycerini TaxID=55779 RepID=A0A6I5ZSH7_9FIRM|nr:lipopolysaccharide biosynthesis protein [Moorella glycerini]QGP92669.1 Polysaccharide biosynthesis protein [Moorella glycerini]